MEENGKFTRKEMKFIKIKQKEIDKEFKPMLKFIKNNQTYFKLAEKNNLYGFMLALKNDKFIVKTMYHEKDRKEFQKILDTAKNYECQLKTLYIKRQIENKNIDYSMQL